MAEFRPTPAQREAIRARGGAVLVSAGAGSGKTRVLTERLMGYLTDPEAPAELDSFLVITFTKAAAGELRGRIMEALAQAQAADPGNLRLRRQSALCRAAQIGTIHSFCAALLRQHSHLAGLTPDFSVADEDRAAAMRSAALERVLDGRYERPEAYPGFELLADTVGAGRDDRRLAELALELYEKMQCHARPERWAAEQAALLDAPAGDAGQTPWGRELLEGTLASAEYWAGEMDRLLAAMAGSGKIEKAYAPSVAGTAEQLREFCRCLRLGWDKARACLPIAFPRLGGLRDSPAPELSDWVKERREACKKAVKGLEAAMGDSSEKLLRELRSTAPAMKALLALALDFDKEYAKEKRRAGLADYADLEHMTARLLTEEDGRPSELARLLSRRYTEIMVDEYQDVSRVQEEIFRAVSREGRNLFLVGDVKQSIYRFRLADPGIFTEKYLGWPDEAAEPGGPRRILLRENFRSRREILEAANGVFSLCMSPELGDIAYDRAAALVPGAEFPGQGEMPELLLLEQPPAGAPDGRDKTALEAALAARTIRRLVDSGALITENGCQRPVTYGDIAILLRSANAVGGVYRRELAKLDIPTAAGQSGDFFRSGEVSAALSLLALIDDPHQDIPLIAALRCPALGFSADELAAVRAAGPDGDLYTALTKRAETDEKSRAFLEKLGALRRAAPDLSASELVWRVLESFDLPAVCAALPDGERRRARLTALAELAGPFEASGYRGLHRFVLWLRKLADRGWEPPLGADSASAVQILSIHRSKGLEFPVVLLCDTGRRFNRQDSQETVLVHPELGLGPKVTDLERRVEYPSLARSAVRRRLEREMLSEEMRLLYVALTRARERLYITGSLKEPEKALAKARGALTRPMPPELLAQAASPLQWLLYAALADEGAHLKLRLCPPEEGTAAGETAAPAPAADEALLGELRRRLAFRYPHPEAAELPSKLTATEMKGREEPDPEAQALEPAPRRPFRLPDFARRDRPLSGAERGTATHLVLQTMDFAQTGDLASVEREIERLRRERFLTDREAQAVDAAAILRLFASPLGRRIREADQVHREFKFSLLWDAGELLGRGAGEELLLQGVVDCFLEEAGTLTVIDYKTDAVYAPEEIRRRAQRYAGQLNAYARALERICRMPVKECQLFFLAPGQAVRVPLQEG